MCIEKSWSHVQKVYIHQKWLVLNILLCQYKRKQTVCRWFKFIYSQCFHHWINQKLNSHCITRPYSHAATALGWAAGIEGSISEGSCRCQARWKDSPRLPPACEGCSGSGSPSLAPAGLVSLLGDTNYLLIHCHSSGAALHYFITATLWRCLQTTVESK